MITAIIQARTGSTRLPNKVLLPLMGKPMLAHVIERVQASQKVDQIILATTTHESDDALADLAESLGVACYQGSENDVLDRYYQAAKLHQASVVVRITGDCPVIDPVVIDRTIGLFESANYAYVNNFLHRTYPDGLDTEVFTFAALETAWQEARLPSEREHVTPYLYKHPEKFPQAGLVQAPDLSHFRWTVDEPVDFEFIQAVYAGLYAQNPLFDMHAITAFLAQNPDLVKLNQAIPTNEGYEKSLREDEKVSYPGVPITVDNFYREALSSLIAIQGHTDLLLMAYSLSDEEKVNVTIIRDHADKLYSFMREKPKGYEKALQKNPDGVNRLLGNLIVTLRAYDIRHSLTIIDAYAQVMLKEIESDSPYELWLEGIKLNSDILKQYLDKLPQMADQLLAYYSQGNPVSEEN